MLTRVCKGYHSPFFPCFDKASSYSFSVISPLFILSFNISAEDGWGFLFALKLIMIQRRTNITSIDNIKRISICNTSLLIFTYFFISKLHIIHLEPFNKLLKCSLHYKKSSLL